MSAKYQFPIFTSLWGSPRLTLVITASMWIICRVSGIGPMSIGTEIMGSISCPAPFTSIYGLKASTGLVSRFGVLPCSTSFGSPGVMAKTTWDLAALLTAVAGPDPLDPATLGDSGCPTQNFVAGLASGWNEMRIGLAGRSLGVGTIIVANMALIKS
jgi:amidase